MSRYSVMQGLVVVSSIFWQHAPLGHLSSTALLREPVRLFTAGTQVGVS